MISLAALTIYFLGFLESLGAYCPSKINRYLLSENHREPAALPCRRDTWRNQMAGTQVASNSTYNGAGGETLNAGNNDTITLSGGNNNITAGDNDVITISGGNNSVSMQDYGSLTLN